MRSGVTPPAPRLRSPKLRARPSTLGPSQGLTGPCVGRGGGRGGLGGTEGHLFHSAGAPPGHSLQQTQKNPVWLKMYFSGSSTCSEGKAVMFLAWHGSRCALAPLVCFSASHTGAHGQFPTTFGPTQACCLVCEGALTHWCMQCNISGSRARTDLIFCVVSISLHALDRYHAKDQVRTSCRS